MGLIFQNISKKYGAVVAIKHAEMEIENGEVRAILGGNGSGKSTLAKALGGLISKNSGEIKRSMEQYVGQKRTGLLIQPDHNKGNDPGVKRL